MAERAPPEVYFTLGYETYVAISKQTLGCYILTGYILSGVHIDNAFCPYAFAYCAGRNIHPQVEVCRDQPYLTRTRKAADNADLHVPEPGANFVDVTIRVVVKQNVGTAISFNPTHFHGTTKGHGASNAIISVTFSKSVGDAWGEARSNGSAVSILSKYPLH